MTSTQLEPGNSIGTERCRQCGICGGGGQILYEGLDDQNYGVSGEYSFARCPNCSFVWLDRRPCPEDIGLCYPTYNPHMQRPAKISVEGGVYTPLRDTVRSIVLQELLRYPGGWESLFAKIAGRLLGSLPTMKHLATFGLDELIPPFVEGGKLLEVGCGAGVHLDRMRRLGWQVTGVDISAQAAQTVRETYGVEVLIGDVRSLSLSKNTFHVITMTHAIEHVYDFNSLLRRCYDLLCPGGRLILTTPNEQGLGHRLFKRNWTPLDVPRHLSLFNSYTLRKTLEVSGFKIIRLFSRGCNSKEIFDLSFETRNVVGRKRRGLCLPQNQPVRSHWASRWLRITAEAMMFFNFNVGEELMVAALKPQS